MKKGLQQIRNPLKFMARPGRLERPTCGFVVRRSIHLSYGRLIDKHTTSLSFGQGQFPLLISTSFKSIELPDVFLGLVLSISLDVIQVAPYRSR